MPGKSSVPEAVDTLMRARRWTPATLAKRAGLPVSTVTRFLGGQRAPQLDTALKIARALEVPLDQIVRFAEGGIDIPPTPEQRVVEGLERIEHRIKNLEEKIEANRASLLDVASRNTRRRAKAG